MWNGNNKTMSLTPELVELKQRPTDLPPDLRRLYEPHVAKVTVLRNFLPTKVPGVNINQWQAAQLIRWQIQEAHREGRGTAIGVFGPMFAGKTTVICLLAREMRTSGETHAVCKHARDFKRYGAEAVNHPGNIRTGARLYQSLSTVDAAFPGVLFLDEFQFCDDKPADAQAFVESRHRDGLSTVFAQLDTDFRREPWGTTVALLPVLDVVVFLGAECDCGRVGYFTQRKVDGKPAHVDDPVVVVGAEELYSAACSKCHEVGGKPKNEMF